MKINPIQIKKKLKNLNPKNVFVSDCVFLFYRFGALADIHPWWEDSKLLLCLSCMTGVMPDATGYDGKFPWYLDFLEIIWHCLTSDDKNKHYERLG